MNTLVKGYNGNYLLKTPYNIDVINILRSIPDAFWNRMEKYWVIPEMYVDEVYSLLQDLKIDIDSDFIKPTKKAKCTITPGFYIVYHKNEEPDKIEIEVPFNKTFIEIMRKIGGYSFDKKKKRYIFYGKYFLSLAEELKKQFDIDVEKSIANYKKCC